MHVNVLWCWRCIFLVFRRRLRKHTYENPSVRWQVPRPDGRGGQWLVDEHDCHDEYDLHLVNVSGGGRRWESMGDCPGNLLMANAFIRRLAAALPRMAASARVPVDPSLLQLAEKLAPLPVGISKKGSTAGEEIYMAAGGLPSTVNTTNAADYLHWIYPAEWITHQSPPLAVARALRTLRATNDNR